MIRLFRREPWLLWALPASAILVLCLWLFAPPYGHSAGPKNVTPQGIPALQVGQVLDQQGGYTTWFNINSTSVRDGTGSFVEFLVPNAAGTMMSSVTFNAGFITATPGKEQGDFEVLTYCNGVSERGGYHCGFVFDGATQALYAPMDGTRLGVPDLPWAETWTDKLGMPVVTCPAKAGGGECVQGIFGGAPGYLKVIRP